MLMVNLLLGLIVLGSEWSCVEGVVSLFGSFRVFCVKVVCCSLRLWFMSLFSSGVRVV